MMSIVWFIYALEEKSMIKELLDHKAVKFFQACIIFVLLWKIKIWVGFRTIKILYENKKYGQEQALIISQFSTPKSYGKILSLCE